jgi:hypothetical protein
LRMLGEIARRHGRKVVALGQSVSTHARVARATARSTGEHAGLPYLEWPSDLVWPADRARELPRRAMLAWPPGRRASRRLRWRGSRQASTERSSFRRRRRGDVQPRNPRKRAGRHATAERPLAARRRASHLVVGPRGACKRARAPRRTASHDRAHRPPRVRTRPRNAAPSLAPRCACARARRP